MPCEGDIPAGRIALDSSTSCVLRSEARMEGWPWGTARLKFDLVAMVDECVCLHGSSSPSARLWSRAIHRSVVIASGGSLGGA
ncbi:hypothetical protein J1614_011864 [Plenodomus biglobosus]|nr:hypothetical protein J1614_011864 [Plenodomus biglobosus]